MTKKIADLTCPECNKEIQVPFEVVEPPTLDEITNTLNEVLKGHPTADQVRKVIREQLEGLKPPKEDHKHKTADEFFDCPECKSWVEQTAQRYQVSPREPEKGQEAQAIGSIFSVSPREPEKGQEAQAIGSIFSSKKEED